MSRTRRAGLLLPDRYGGVGSRGTRFLAIVRRVVVEDEGLSETYDASLAVLTRMEKVVESLFTKASSLK